MLGAFIARFGLGFVICNIRLPWPGWIVGLRFGRPAKPSGRDYHERYDANPCIGCDRWPHYRLDSC